MTSAVEQMKQSGIAFGTSGARGLVTDFTVQSSAAFALAFLKSQGNVTRLAIAIDNRPSSPGIAQACIAAAKHYGVEVDYYGILPTPALAHTSLGDAVPAIMVTGSHIPFDRNGLKFYRADGEISKEDEVAIMNVDIDLPDIHIEPLLDASPRAFDQYMNRYLDVFPKDILSGKRIGIYEHSSSGREIYHRLFSALGAEAISLGRSDEFIPIDTEAVSQDDIRMAQAWKKEHALDAVFSTDGDGDRPLLSDETGTYLRGDILCLLAAKALNIEALALPVSCNSAIEKCGAFKHVSRTKIGSPYVVAAMETLEKEYASVAGFEANGGFLLGSDINLENGSMSALVTRDAILPALAVLSSVQEAPISQQVKALPQRFTASDRLQNFPRENSIAILENVLVEPQSFLNRVGLKALNVDNIDQTDGVRLTLNDASVVHLRPSGNAPELRCYTESESEEKSEKMLKAVFECLLN